MKTYYENFESSSSTIRQSRRRRPSANNISASRETSINQDGRSLFSDGFGRNISLADEELNLET
ncbi:28079_t:CDS:2 [Dentiscutata erythropus]|uniref:28079_t:CDS:1 n=1 Tax=Dentiscutata erythropus TaxID=1348616 RepID=A0A9N9K3W0_9GLOM|nr:28079_t:CDS:2 [Dentiscutata erythropus]